MKDYEINEETMAIIPLNYNQTMIKEVNNEYIIDKSAYKIMEDSCEYYGSTYKGRLKAAQKLYIGKKLIIVFLFIFNLLLSLISILRVLSLRLLDFISSVNAGLRAVSS